MNAEQIMKIFADTAYIRTGGSPEELRTAQYLQDKIAGLGLKAEIVPLDVPMSRIQEAVLQVGGVEVTCKGYLCAGSGEVKAPFYYLRDSSPYALSKCRGKIVMIDGYLGYWVYHDLLENGAVGFVTYDGNTNYADRDIDQRELRSYVHNGNRIPGVNINAKDAVELIRRGASTAKIALKQEEYTGQSHNVVLDMPGQVDEYIAFTAHYDSTSLSQGAYDNMSGSLGILGIAEHFAAHPHRYGLRFIWCGSEERGLLGSPVEVKQDVYSSDSTPFADKGVPAVSFARIAPPNTATIHNRYDTMALMKGEQMVLDTDFLIAFAERMANAARCPVAREMPENMKEKLDIYLCRKRAPKQ